MHDMQIVPFHIIDLFDELDDKLYAFERLYVEFCMPRNLHQNDCA